MTSWTEQLYAERENKPSKQKDNRNYSTNSSQLSFHHQSISSPFDKLSCIKFDPQIVSRRELSKISNIDVKVLAKLEENGFLEPVYLPGLKRPQYSTQQLTVAIKEYNKKFKEGKLYDH